MRVNSPAALNDAIELIKNGASTKDACIAHNITIGSLEWHIKKTGIKIRDMRPIKRSDEKHKDGKFLGIYTKQEIIEMAVIYNSWKTVAKITGASCDSIKCWASKNGLKINKRKTRISEQIKNTAQAN